MNAYSIRRNRRRSTGVFVTLRAVVRVVFVHGPLRARRIMTGARRFWRSIIGRKRRSRRRRELELGSLVGPPGTAATGFWFVWGGTGLHRRPSASVAQPRRCAHENSPVVLRTGGCMHASRRPPQPFVPARRLPHPVSQLSQRGVRETSVFPTCPCCRLSCGGGVAPRRGEVASSPTQRRQPHEGTANAIGERPRRAVDQRARAVDGAAKARTFFQADAIIISSPSISARRRQLLAVDRNTWTQYWQPRQFDWKLGAVFTTGGGLAWGIEHVERAKSKIDPLQAETVRPDMTWARASIATAHAPSPAPAVERRGQAGERRQNLSRRRSRARNDGGAAAR